MATTTYSSDLFRVPSGPTQSTEQAWGQGQDLSRYGAAGNQKIGPSGQGSALAGEPFPYTGPSAGPGNWTVPTANGTSSAGPEWQTSAVSALRRTQQQYGSPYGQGYEQAQQAQQQYGSPYGQSYGNPYGQQYGAPTFTGFGGYVPNYGQQYGQGYGNPYAQQYGQSYGNPYSQQYGQGYGNPYGQQYGQPAWRIQQPVYAPLGW